MGTPVFPSLARGTVWGASQKVEDGTIRDKMEMGQVMTRQRFSRLRRTWKVEYNLLNQTDMLAVDFFHRTTVQGGALPFYWANKIANGGFEYNTTGPAAGTAVTSGTVCDGWSITLAPNGAVAALSTATARSGANSLQISGVPSYELPANATEGLRVYSAPVAATPGQTLALSGFLNVSLASLPSGATLAARIGFFFADSSGQLLESFPADTTAVTSGWVQVGTSAIAPANTTQAYVECCLFLINTTGSAIAMPSTPFATVNFDDVGLALVSPTASYGNMPNSGSLPVAVRFPKPVEIVEAGWVNNGAAYRVQFELEEV